MPKAYVNDGDIGCGLPGSLDWHKCAVAELSPEDVATYFLEVAGTLSDDDAIALLLHLIEGDFNGNGA